jgi:AcrR family transcriptional regulator
MHNLHFSLNADCGMVNRMGKEPASPPQKIRKRDITRRRIAEESLKLYEAQGYAETTLAQISVAAGISARTLYLHFPTKEDTLRYWREDGFLDDLPGVMERLAAQPSPLATAQAGIAALIARQDPAHSARVDRLLESNEALWANKQAIFIQFERILHEWLCRHWPNEGCAAMQTVAMIATGTMRLAMDHWREGGSVRPIGAYLDEEFERLSHALGQDQREVDND